MNNGSVVVFVLLSTVPCTLLQGIRPITVTDLLCETTARHKNRFVKTEGVCYSGKRYLTMTVQTGQHVW